MKEDFKMEISKEDFLDLLNEGLKWKSTTSRFVSERDKIVDFSYSRHTKQITLEFEGGDKARVTG